MNINKTFRIIVGVLLLINTVTIFALLFIEIESLAVLFDFGIDIQAENLGEAIAGLAASIAAGIVFFIAMVMVGIINILIYTVIGVLTLVLKRTKAMPIIVLIITALGLYIGVRALIILSLGGYPSIILPLRVTSDIAVIALSVTSLILTFREGKIPRLESSN
ncbi:MAG: hypothetical protein KGD70_04285 [Candidatus Lokiarchaeota archaeon]|nr:hypothetical protein [Candidatus Lokiarchaeota archaeon]